MTTGWERAVVVLGALAGLAGVGLAAAAAHGTGGGTLDTAARFLLAHAPALLAIAALVGTGHLGRFAGRVAAALLALGLVLFCGDLTVRAFAGIAPLRLAAPTGGVLLMLGWAALALAALWPQSPAGSGRP